MKKLVLALVVTALLGLNGSVLKANDMEPKYCPVKAMERASELKLSDAQKKQLEQIKEDGMKAFQDLKAKVEQDTKAVLTAKQVKKYDDLSAKAAESKEGKCDKCEKKEKCEKCAKGEKCEKCKKAEKCDKCDKAQKGKCEGDTCERPDKKKAE